MIKKLLYLSTTFNHAYLIMGKQPFIGWSICSGEGVVSLLRRGGSFCPALGWSFYSGLRGVNLTGFSTLTDKLIKWLPDRNADNPSHSNHEMLVIEWNLLNKDNPEVQKMEWYRGPS
jgi:hypothetical protein